MPTAVITESSENTMSMQHDLHDHAGEATRTARRARARSSPFELLVDLVRALREQEQAADEQDQVAPRDRRARATVNSGAVSRIDPGDRQQQQRCA